MRIIYIQQPHRIYVVHIIFRYRCDCDYLTRNENQTILNAITAHTNINKIWMRVWHSVVLIGITLYQIEAHN